MAECHVDATDKSEIYRSGMDLFQRGRSSVQNKETFPLTRTKESRRGPGPESGVRDILQKTDTESKQIAVTSLVITRMVSGLPAWLLGSFQI